MVSSFSTQQRPVSSSSTQPLKSTPPWISAADSSASWRPWRWRRPPSLRPRRPWRTRSPEAKAKMARRRAIWKNKKRWISDKETVYRTWSRREDYTLALASRDLVHEGRNGHNLGGCANLNAIKSPRNLLPISTHPWILATDSLAFWWSMASKFATMLVLTNKVAKGQSGGRSEKVSFFWQFAS